MKMKNDEQREGKPLVVRRDADGRAFVEVGITKPAGENEMDEARAKAAELEAAAELMLGIVRAEGGIPLYVRSRGGRVVLNPALKAAEACKNGKKGSWRARTAR